MATKIVMTILVICISIIPAMASIALHLRANKKSPDNNGD